MSMTPIPPERCGHVAPMVIDRAEGGYAARCLRWRDRGSGAGNLHRGAEGVVRLGAAEPEIVAADSVPRHPARRLPLVLALGRQRAEKRPEAR